MNLILQQPNTDLTKSLRDGLPRLWRSDFVQLEFSD